MVELLAAPDTLYEMVPVGPITKQTAWMRDLLAEESSSAVIVTLAEDLPVTETLSLNERITTESSVRVQAVVANRLPAELGAPGMAEAARLAKKDGPIGVAAQMILDRRRRADEALEPLFESISVPILTVSECDNESRLVHHVALTVEDLL